MHLPRRFAPAILSALTAVAIVGCSGGAASPAGSSLPSVALPSVALPSVALPSVALPSELPSVALPSDLPSVALPSDLPSVALPSDLPSISLPPLPSDLPSISLPPVALPSGLLPSGLPSLAPIPTFHLAPELEAQLPSEIRGTPLEKSSFTGDLFLGSTPDQNFAAVLQQFGKQPSDLAIAGVRDPSDTLEFGLFAFQLAGVDGNQFIDALFKAGQATGSIQPTITTGTLGNKQVTIFTDDEGTKSYAYVRGDVSFFMESEAEDADALLGEVASTLP